MPSLCRDGLHRFEGDGPCPACASRRVVRHPELWSLSIAHMDCDAFFAAVEKRDNPGLRDLPVIVGGGTRGVVSTCCYLARLRGVRSAMPMFQALRLCPEAVVVKPRFAAYVEASRAIRAMMEALTPRVEPLSLDEAFLDLSGTERLHGAPPAALMAGLVRRMETELGLTGSVGLAPNKFLAKIASEMDKPRGFAVIGRGEARTVLAPRPISAIWGVGPAAEAQLAAAGIHRVGDVTRWAPEELARRFGHMGARLWRLAHGEDARDVAPRDSERVMSHETTLHADTADPDELERHLWPLCEKLSARAKAKGRAGSVVILKLKTSGFRLLTRRVTLARPTQLADTIWRAVQPMLAAIDDPGPFRLIGVGLSGIVGAAGDAGEGDLFDPGAAKRAGAERAADAIRARFGADAIRHGRSLR